MLAHFLEHVYSAKALALGWENLPPVQEAGAESEWPSPLAADTVVGFTSDLQPALDRHSQKSDEE